LKKAALGSLASDKYSRDSGRFISKVQAETYFFLKGQTILFQGDSITDWGRARMTRI